MKDKEAFEKAFEEYCKFDKLHIKCKGRFKSMWDAWDESKNFLSVDVISDITCNELEYFKSLGWNLISIRGYSIFFLMDYTTCIFGKEMSHE